MIHLFSKKHPIFPIRWANSIANWCLGVCSPKGTISIKNTATPKDGGRSLELDVNIEKVFSLLAKSLDGKNLSEVQKKGVAKIIEGSVNQKIITYRDGILDIDTERLKQYLEENADDESDEVSTPFELSVEINSGGTAVTEVDIFLPSLNFTYGGVEYAVETGSGTGLVTAVETGSKWYCINGVGAGDLWIVDDSTSTANRMKFTQTAPSDDKPFVYIGKVSIKEVEGKKVGDGGQFYSPKRGFVDFGGGGGGGGGSTPTKTLQLSALPNSATPPTAVGELRVYLPSLTFGFGRTDYAIQTGTAAGYVQAVAGAAGWYKISGITSGNIYLVDSSTTTSGGVTTFKAKFSTSPSSTPNTLSHFVGVVGFASGAPTVQQSEQAMQGWSGSFDMEHASGANQNLKEVNTSGGQSTPAAGWPLDTNGWERDVTKTLNSSGTQVSELFNGIEMTVVSRVVRKSQEDMLFWRKVTFDKNGCLYKISPEQGVFFVKNENFY